MSEAKNAVAAVNADRAGEEYVSVRLFKDSGKYKDDLLVCVNGESCLIQRGVTVQVKRKFQRATVGWKATKVAERLVEAYMIRVETTSTFDETPLT